jgi:Biotin-protein ligase, N terminal
VRTIAACAGYDKTPHLPKLSLHMRSRTSYLIPFSVDVMEVRTLGTADLLAGSWRRRCVLLVMPGGADLPYCRHLNGAGNELISGGTLLMSSMKRHFRGWLACVSDLLEIAAMMRRDVQGMSERTAAHTSVCARVHTMLPRASSLKPAPGPTLMSCALQSASCFHQRVPNQMVLHLLWTVVLVIL